MSDLNEAEQERIRRLRRKVYEVAPEVVPFFIALHAEGLVPGWRAVAYAGPHRPTTPGYTGPIYSGTEHIPRRERK